MRVAPLVLDPHGGRVQIELHRVVHLAARAFEIRIEIDPLGHARLEREVRAERGVHHTRHVEECGPNVLAGRVHCPQRRRLPVRACHVGEHREQDHALHRKALALRVISGESEAEYGHIVELVGVGSCREMLRELDAERVAHHDLAFHGVDGEATDGIHGLDGDFAGIGRCVICDAGVLVDAAVGFVTLHFAVLEGRFGEGVES